jgi:tRNA threonylcarbamoyladenosine biosynthesis protein TsaB
MLLAIDTSTRMLGLGLHSGERVLTETIWQTNRHHTVELSPQIALLLRRSGVSASDLTAVAVAVGPGSYTGLRIGMAMAKGLAFARGLKLVGVSTFDILVHAQPARPEPILALIEAGRGKVAGLWYKWGRRGWSSEGEAIHLAWEDLPGIVEEKSFLIGDIDPVLRKELDTYELIEVALPSICVRRPSVLAEIAFKRMRTGKLPASQSLVPVYLKNP